MCASPTVAAVSLSVLAVDLIGESSHGREFGVIAPLLGRFGCGAPSGSVMAAIDPHRRQPSSPGRHVIVEEALRDVKKLITCAVQLSQYCFECVEMGVGGLVG